MNGLWKSCAENTHWASLPYKKTKWLFLREWQLIFCFVRVRGKGMKWEEVGLWEERELIRIISEDCTCCHVKLLVHSQQLKQSTELVEFLGSLGSCRTWWGGWSFAPELPWSETEAIYEGAGAKTEGHPQGPRRKQNCRAARISPRYWISGSSNPSFPQGGKCLSHPCLCMGALSRTHKLKVHFLDLYQMTSPRQTSRRALRTWLKNKWRDRRNGSLWFWEYCL